ncbi:serine hydrolase [Ktedonobacter robiniae]|uniref:Beta-lactamase-related domain-containing protein n=1 Tax=Ktedonobacter robiniae TaxID=2778365 RepID=A0ABQ3V0P6_9CHLR|nr:serine hydrolase domain-containing protein [Ktedonobacter robiniae]GHO58464.1 hypothetical protein KSB_69390 [Ktedonobacter robiniae]
MGDFHLAPDYKAKLATWQSAAETMNGLLEIVKQQPLQSTPGTVWSYSNSGYVVLGAIVAKVSEMDYYDYIHQRVFAAAGMSKSRFYTKPQREQTAATSAGRYALSTPALLSGAASLWQSCWIAGSVGPGTVPD